MARSIGTAHLTSGRKGEALYRLPELADLAGGNWLVLTGLPTFADFGFPESHAFSFAYLVYASAWLKVHASRSVYAGLLAAQPMGFYSPQSLIADARRRGVCVERASVRFSQVQATVENRHCGEDQ